MSGNAQKSAQIKSVDPVWEAVRVGARQILDSDPALGKMALTNVLNHDSFEEALAHRLAARLAHEDVSADIIRQTLAEILRDVPAIGEAAVAVVEVDPGRVVDRVVAALRRHLQIGRAHV